MAVKELRQGMRAPMFIAPFILVHVAAIICVALEHQRGGVSDWESPFWIMSFLVLALIMPLRGFGALREECDGGNSGLLMLGGLTRWQIIRGKWLVQLLLTGLTFFTLLPYLLVRYYLGGFDPLANVLIALNVVSMAAAMSAIVIGASGYRAVPMRFVACAVGGFWVLAGGGVAQTMIAALFESFGFRRQLEMWSAFASALGVQWLYAICGLQLGRAHLKLYLLPYEIVPTRSVMSLMIFLPFILLAGGLATLGYGLIVVLAIIIFSMCRYDRPWKPGRLQSPGQITGMDINWRPLQ
jgi:hypothetical protein